MTPFALFADIGTDLAETAQSTAEKFGLDLPHFAAQVISFLIVAGALYVFAYKPILKVLEERRQRIAEGLANAEKIKMELAQTNAARQEILKQANDQANKLVEQARMAADHVREQEIRKAMATAEQIIARAHETAASDYARMLAELRRELGRLVVETAAKVSGKILTAEDQQRLAEEVNRELAA
jgi:F-type H+-transporting ATPase subunit b